MLKTGASGMIAYRYQKKDGEWQWLQTSSRLVYKNSKPDFVISTHRQLMEEEGKDLLGKRTMDFKVLLLSNIFQRNRIIFDCIAGELFGYGTCIDLFLRSRSVSRATVWITELTIANTIKHATTSNATIQNAATRFSIDVPVKT